MVRSFAWCKHRADAAWLFWTLVYDILIGVLELARGQPPLGRSSLLSVSEFAQKPPRPRST